MRHWSIAATVFFVALLPCLPARADSSNYSGITFFRADVTVKQDSTIEVREEIVLNDAASFYKTGFLRILPISSDDRRDPRYVGEAKLDNGVRADILEVTEDGQKVVYSQGTRQWNSQLLIGDRRRNPLDSGGHHFVIRYTVSPAVSLGPSRDTLYWNAIGTQRNVPVEEAILAVHLPAAIPAESVLVEPRVGGLGLNFAPKPDTTLERVTDSSGAIVYRATNVAAHQSLSVALTWPSGYIHKPWLDFVPREAWVLAAPALLFLFYLISWFRIGPEPKPGTVVARYEPPEGLSPAAVRYVAIGSTDGRSFAAVIAQLALRGCLRVEPPDEKYLAGKYKLSRLMSDHATESTLAPEEVHTLASLFEDGPVVELSPSMEQRNTARNGRYVMNIHQELTRQLGNKYLTRHTGIIALGVLFTFVSALLIAVTQGRSAADGVGAVFFTIWILFMGLTLGLMIELSFASAWKMAIRARTGWLQLLPGTAAIAIFAAAIVYMLKKLAEGVSLSYAIMLVALLAVNLAWGPFLKRKTPLGREVSDQIAGFRLFLEKVEQDQLNRLGPAQQSSADLDAGRFLPYAIALDVKATWGDHLAHTFITTSAVVEG